MYRTRLGTRCRRAPDRCPPRSGARRGAPAELRGDRVHAVPHRREAQRLVRVYRRDVRVHVAEDETADLLMIQTECTPGGFSGSSGSVAGVGCGHATMRAGRRRLLRASVRPSARAWGREERVDARWRRVRAARRRCAFGLDYFSRELKRALRFGLRESIAIGRSVAFDRKLIARPGSADRCDVSWRSSRPSASVALIKAHVAAASRSSCSGAASPRSAPSRHGRPQRYPPRPRLRGQEGRLQDVRARADAPRRRRDPRRGPPNPRRSASSTSPRAPRCCRWTSSRRLRRT